MEPNVRYVVVGSFVLVLGAAILGAILWLGKTSYGTAYDRYYTFLRESVAGLSVNSTVKYRGVDVGRVKAIILNPSNPEEVRLTLDIERGTPVKTDTIAVLETQGLTGLSTVNLAGGSRDAPSLERLEGQEYPVIQAGPSLLSRLDEAVSQLLSEQRLSTLLGHLDVVAKRAADLFDEHDRARVKQTLTDVSDVVRTIAARREQIDHGISSAAQSAESLHHMASALDKQVPMMVGRLNHSLVALENLTQDLAQTSRAVAAVAKSAGPEVDRFSQQTLPEASLLIAELRQLTSTLQRVARDIEREPNALVFGRKPAPRGPGE